MPASILTTLRQMSGLVQKSDEANATTDTGNGAEFLRTDLVPQILENIHQQDFLYTRIPGVKTMTSPVVNVPVQGAEVAFSVAAENVNDPTAAGPYTATKVNTAQATLTAKKLALRIPFTTEMVEDNATDQDFDQYVVQYLQYAFPRAIDDMLINGDTTSTTANINTYTATAVTTTPYNRFNGLVKAALDNSKKVDGGTLDTADIRSARALMGLRGANPSDLVAVMDLPTYYKLLSLGQVETIEKFGVNATITNGVLSHIDGMEVLKTNIMAASDANGRIDGTTAGNNTKGRILIAHKPSLVMGFRRQLTIEPYVDKPNDQLGIIATFRYAQALPFGAVTDAGQALVYNITV